MTVARDLVALHNHPFLSKFSQTSWGCLFAGVGGGSNDGSGLRQKLDDLNSSPTGSSLVLPLGAVLLDDSSSGGNTSWASSSKRG
mmetsp:Transcript_30653/g.93793  ORF Transcript_30653/g.93793 Transcript_30653/m.93793 type:complete len:85 (+) Transcript_30653:752-1006(+)